MAKYVVVSNLVCNEYHRGRVLDGDAFGGALQRLLDLGAVRKASAEEAKLAQVSFPEGNKHLVLEAQLEEAQEEILRLRGRISDLTQELEKAQTEGQRVRPDPPTVKRLKARVQELEDQLAAQAQTAPVE